MLPSTSMASLHTRSLYQGSLLHQCRSRHQQQHQCQPSPMQLLRHLNSKQRCCQAACCVTPKVCAPTALHHLVTTLEAQMQQPQQTLHRKPCSCNQQARNQQHQHQRHSMWTASQASSSTRSHWQCSVLQRSNQVAHRQQHQQAQPQQQWQWLLQQQQHHQQSSIGPHPCGGCSI